MRSRLTLLLLTLAVAPVASVVRAAEPRAEVAIERVQWGFDGKAPARTFVPLSVLVQNHSPGEFEGTLRLTKSLQLSEQIDAVLERDVYLGPLSSRWVQLVPYVFDEWEQWQLTWVDLEAEPFKLPTPNAGDLATVLVYDPDELQTAGGVLHRFPTDLFPTSVTALDGLRGVVLDRPPRWQGARRQAFLDWLQLGGRVYLLQDDQGQYPNFGEGLSVLNRSQDGFQVGSGHVRRLPRTVASLDPKFIHDEILHDEQGRYGTAEWRQFRNSRTFQGSMPMINRNGWDRDTNLLRELQELSRFRRNWLAIYGLVAAYVLALFPGCYWLGRRVKAYEWFYVGFLVVTGLFSFGFASLGRLGAADLARIRSVVVAHQIGEGLYDVTGWASAAAKVGGDYTIQHAGNGRLYTAASEIESVRGRIVAGPAGRMEADIPPASTRTFIHRARQEGPPLGIRIERIAIDAGDLAQLAISVGPEFPDDPLSVYVWHAVRAYRMEAVGTEWRLIPASRKSGVTFLTDLREIAWTFGLRTSISGTRPGEKAITDDFESLERRLIGNSFGLNNEVDPLKIALGPDTIRVFVYAPMPAEFQATGDEFPDQYGCVLYVVDLPTTPGFQSSMPDRETSPSDAPRSDQTR